MMAHEFGLMRRLLKEHSGLNLGSDKQDMLEGKLRPLLREFDLPSLSHLVLMMMRPDAHHLHSRVAQAVTVQESYFFRDKVPFDYFVDGMLPKLMAKREASRRIQGLVRGGRDRARSPIRWPWSWRSGTASCRLDDRDPGHRLCRGCAGQGAQRALQPVRGATGPAGVFPPQIFRQGRERMGAQPRHSRQGRISQAKSPRQLSGARHVRRDLLPERADLFRRADQA